MQIEIAIIAVIIVFVMSYTGRLDLNNSSGKAVNSTTINDNMSSAL